MPLRGVKLSTRRGKNTESPENNLNAIISMIVNPLKVGILLSRAARSYGTRALRSTRSRLALRRTGRRPRLAIVAADGRLMDQLYDWEAR